MANNLCQLCGEPLPKGEEMFKLHGYSCDCPKSPLPKQSEPDINTLKYALEESVKLQSHYAKLLNEYDGGTRMEFTAESWLERMKNLV